MNTLYTYRLEFSSADELSYFEWLLDDLSADNPHKLSGDLVSAEIENLEDKICSIKRSQS